VEALLLGHPQQEMVEPGLLTQAEPVSLDLQTLTLEAEEEVLVQMEQQGPEEPAGAGADLRMHPEGQLLLEGRLVPSTLVGVVEAAVLRVQVLVVDLELLLLLIHQPLRIWRLLELASQVSHGTEAHG
jgi:hypothetical protein